MCSKRCAQSIEYVVRRMAEREAAAHLLHPLPAALVESPITKIFIHVESCPWCGWTVSAKSPNAGLMPLREMRILHGSERASQGSATLSALACESLTARSLLILALGLERGTGLLTFSFVTRSVAWARMLRNSAESAIADVVARLDASEAWADELLGVRPPSAAVPISKPPYTLPASTRHSMNVLLHIKNGRTGQRNTAETFSRIRNSLHSHFITPHLNDVFLDSLNRVYEQWRLSKVAISLDGRVVRK